MFAHAAPPTISVPYLVSFPRTGSHWLRCFLELYFDRPLLTRSFYPHQSDDFLLHHTHDLDDEIQDRRDVIYLYRGVVNTVFSQLTYHHGESANDLGAEEVLGVAREYRRHLRKWLLRRDSSLDRCVLTYESLLDRPVEVLAGVVRFLGGAADLARVEQIWPTVTLESVKDRASHDPRVISNDGATHLRRELFRYRWGRRVLDVFLSDPELPGVMDPGTLM